MSINKVKDYKQYKDYVDDQCEKTLRVKKSQRRFNKKVGQFQKRFRVLKKDNLIQENHKALCLGARLGEEVQALINLGVNAVGVDLVANLPLVIKADFHALPQKKQSQDVVYTNAFDHIFNPDAFIENIIRVLKDDGILIIDIFLGDSMIGSKEVYSVDNEDDIVNLFCNKYKLQLVTVYKNLPSLYKKKHINYQFVFKKVAITKEDFY